MHLRCNETKPCEVSFTEVNWKQVLHITVGQHSVRDLESREMGITKKNSPFRKRTVIKPFPCLVRGKDNSRKCNGEIKFYFVKRHFGVFFCFSEIISKPKSGIF